MNFSPLISTGDSSWIPPAVGLTSYFQYLPVRERENPYHLQKLRDETDEMKRKFSNLVFDLLQDLKKSTTLNDVVTLLVLNCHHKFQKLLKDCTNLDEVFKAISKFISFFDYGPIKLLSSKFASNTLKKKLKKYKKKFQDYAKRRLCECPSDAFEKSESNEKVFVIKTESDITTITLEEVQKLEYEMNKILGHTFLHLLNVKEGCLELVFRILEDIEFTISEDQKQALKRLGVISISYGEESIPTSPEQILDEVTKIPG